MTNLLEVLDYIGTCLDNGGQVDMLYLDMSKVFDRINHKRLILKLSNSGIGGNLLNWFESYLTDRRQRVTVPQAPFPLPQAFHKGQFLVPHSSCYT